MSNKIYQGRRATPKNIVLVLDTGTQKATMLNPASSQAVRSYTPDFDWSYGGNGANQLALAILLDAIGNQPVEQRISPETAATLADRYHILFCGDHVTHFGESWKLEDAVIYGWLRNVVSQAKVKKEQYSHEPTFPKELGGQPT